MSEKYISEKTIGQLVSKKIVNAVKKRGNPYEKKYSEQLLYIQNKIINGQLVKNSDVEKLKKYNAKRKGYYRKNDKAVEKLKVNLSTVGDYLKKIFARPY